MNTIDSVSGKETSATHAAYRTLRKMILTGALPAGQKLKIEEIRNKLALGASPVREALSLLTSDMLVERIDQRGFRTAPASLANFKEILALRSALEGMALRQSLERSTPEWEEQLVLSHHRMTRAAKQNAADFEDAHKAFHMTLLANSASPMLERYCSQLYDLNIRYRYLAASGENYQKRDVSAEHRDLLNAALEHDIDAAAERLLSHYSLTGEYLSTKLGALI